VRPRRLTAAAVLAVALAAGGARGQGFKQSTELREEVSAASTADTFLNPDGRLFAADRVASRLRLRSDATLRLPAGFTLKGRGTFDLVHRDGARREFDWAVPEAYLQRSLGPFHVSAGRRILRWSNGYAFNPAGLLDPVRDPADPQDRLGRFEGRDLVELDLYAGEHTLTAVYAPGRRLRLPGSGDRDQETVAARYHVLWRGLDLALMGARRPGATDAAAVSASYVIGEALEVHAEGLASRGSSLALPRSALPGAQETLFGPDFYALLRQDERRVYLRFLVGTNYTMPGGLNLVVEYLHAPDGLSSGEWNRFLEQARYSRGLAEGGGFPPVLEGRTLPELNLLLAMRGLGAGTLGQDYGFVRLAHPSLRPGLEPSVLALANLRDGSFAWIPEVSLRVQDRLTVYGRAVLMSGGAASEFGNVPVSRSFNLGLRLAF
jgi:hypothetical protein